MEHRHVAPFYLLQTLCILNEILEEEKLHLPLSKEVRVSYGGHKNNEHFGFDCNIWRNCFENGLRENICLTILSTTWIMLSERRIIICLRI